MNPLTYLRTTTATIEEVRQPLWTAEGMPPQDARDIATYHLTILEQYKMYVEMADRVSARRGLANTFFLTLNTLVITTVAAFWKDRPPSAVAMLAISTAALVLQCAAWFWLLRSYRQLNSAKYLVIGALEERLPASPYYRAEWKALGEGRTPSRYWPLTHLEQWIPLSFAFVYLAGFVVVLVG